MWLRQTYSARFSKLLGLSTRIAQSLSSGHWAIKAAQASLMRSETKMKVPGGRAAMWSCRNTLMVAMATVGDLTTWGWRWSWSSSAARLIVANISALSESER